MTSVENRRHIRIDSLNLSHIIVTEEGLVVYQGMGRTLNVSESGILLETKFQMPVGDELIVSIGFEDDLLELKGHAVFSKETRPGMQATGIEFADIDSAILPKLRSFIKTFQA
jgi:hypothetical protein